MKKQMKKKKLLLLLSMILMFTQVLTGCDSFDPNDLVDGFDDEMEARALQNKMQVERLFAAGFITQSEKETILKDIDKRFKSLGPELLQSVTDMGLLALMSKEELADKFNANVTKTIDLDGLYEKYGITAKTDNMQEERVDNAINLVSNDLNAIKKLMERLQFPLYVLKKNEGSTGDPENNTVTLEQISEAVRLANERVTADPRDESSLATLEPYFIDTGKKLIQLRDDVKEGDPIKEGLIIQKSVKAPEWDSSLTHNINELGVNFVGVKTKVVNGQVIMRWGIEWKFREFNARAIDRLIGKGDVNAKKILIIGKKAFLMEYPVEYVKGFEKDGEKEYRPVYARSDMKVNILTNQTLDKEGRLAESHMGNRLKVYTDTGMQRLTGDLGVNSFVLDGVKGELTEYGYLPYKNGKELEPINKDKYGRIVLRDYLELFHAPSVVSGENLIATGRILRITKFKGTASDEMALFIDKSGGEMKNADGAQGIKLKIKDFMDLKSGFGNNDKYKLDLKEELNETETDTQVTEGKKEGDEDSTSSIAGYQKNLKENKVGAIETTTRFPGDRVALNDDLEFKGSTNVEESTPSENQTNTPSTENQTENPQETPNTPPSNQDNQTPTPSNQDNQTPPNQDNQTPINPPNTTPVETPQQSKLKFIREDNVHLVKSFMITPKDRILLSKWSKQREIEELDKMRAPVSVYQVASASPQLLLALNNQSQSDSANREEEVDRGENETNVLGNEKDQQKMKHFFYGMAIDLDPYLSNLVSGWVKVNGDGGEVGSLDWWNYWLGGSGYNYRVDRVKLENYFLGNYNYEAKDTGSMLLDLNTIAKIQEDLDEYHQSSFISLVRTAFTLLGFFLLAYAFFVMMAWVYDVNVTVGPRILTVITGGKWVAISVGDEMPTMDLESKQYMNFARVLRGAFVISIIGGILIFLDIIVLVDGLVRLIGTFGTAIWKTLRGMN